MRDHSGDSATLMRVALKPADAFELVMADGSLANSDVVGALGARAQEVLARGVVRRYADRAVVFQAGEEGGSLFIVLAGEVQLLGRRDSDSVEFGAVHKGGVFGEGEVLAGIRVRCSSALARGEADLVEIVATLRQVLCVKG